MTNIDVFNEIKRRVDLTRRARIKASARLREKHEFFEKVSHIDSVIVLVFSIWFINSPDGDITKVLLIASLSLTFFSMFLGNKNYKERASNFESNYQQLSVLLNKLQRLEVTPHLITDLKLKELHRDYEKLILEKENHIEIDYMTINDDLSQKYKLKIKEYNKKQVISKMTIAILPLAILLIALFLFQYSV